MKNYWSDGDATATSTGFKPYHPSQKLHPLFNERMSEDMLKAVVTGAAGFVGSHLTDRLLQTGNEVTGYDNFDDYYSNKEANLELARKNPKFHAVRSDILDTGTLAKSCRDSDLIFHEAAQPGVRYSLENPNKTFRTNLQGTISVLEAARVSDTPKLVFASTSAVYGNTVKRPVSEDAEPRPISPYGMSKLLAEKICRQYSELYGLRIVILRYHTVYGPRQRPDMAIRKWITNLLSNKPPVIYGDGCQTRDFTYVDDIVNASIDSAYEERAENVVINLGSGVAVTVNATVDLLRRIMDKPHLEATHEERKVGDVADTLADTSKAKTILRYEPRTTLQEGLRKEVEWCIQGNWMPPIRQDSSRLARRNTLPGQVAQC
jgi:UDP-glucose 4-epimerase